MCIRDSAPCSSMGITSLSDGSSSSRPMMARGFEWTSSHTSAGREIASSKRSFSMIRSSYSRDASLMERDNRRPSLLAESVRAHALIFETPLAPSYGNATGIRMLVAFLAVGVVMFLSLRFVATAAGVRGAPATNLGFVVVLLAAFVVGQRTFVGLPMAAVGLRRFADW